LLSAGPDENVIIPLLLNVDCPDVIVTLPDPAVTGEVADTASEVPVPMVIPPD